MSFLLLPTVAPHMPAPLIPPSFLFRFAALCRYRKPLWPPDAEGLGEEHRLVPPSGLDGDEGGLDVRLAWSEDGLALSAWVEGKQQSLWCRANRPEDSDGLQVWIDTRDVRNVHRAGRFCHRFVLLPAGGKGLAEPVVEWLPIGRAREHPQAIPRWALAVRSAVHEGGYRLDAFFAAAALTGFDPAEHPRLGFTYALADRELPLTTFTVGPPFPYQEDPSLWATLELVR